MLIYQSGLRLRQRALSATVGRTKREDACQIWEKTGKFVHAMFLQSVALPCWGRPMTPTFRTRGAELSCHPPTQVILQGFPVEMLHTLVSVQSAQTMIDRGEAANEGVIPTYTREFNGKTSGAV
jgi:hypothetical protein